MTADDETEALFDHQVLSVADDQSGKMALQVGGIGPEGFQKALERAQRRDWIRLIDISPVASAQPGVLFRIFMLTDEGWHRRRQVKAIADAAPKGNA